MVQKIIYNQSKIEKTSFIFINDEKKRELKVAHLGDPSR